MDPGFAENQGEQSQKKQSEGGISQGINTLNNLRGINNSFGKTGLKATRLAVQLGTKFGTFLFATPAGWVTLGIGLVVIFTVIIISSSGTASAGIDDQTINLTPAATITPINIIIHGETPTPEATITPWETAAPEPTTTPEETIAPTNEPTPTEGPTPDPLAEP